MSEKKRSLTSKILLFAGMFGFPAFFILFFALGKQNFEFLQYYGEHTVVTKMIDGKEVTDTVYYKVPQFKFDTPDGGILTQKDFKDKILVINFIQMDCPNECNMDLFGFKEFVAEEIMANDGFKDVEIISCVLDTVSNDRILEFIEDHEINTDRWHIVTGNMAQIYDVDMKTQNPWREKDVKFGYEVVAYTMTLLLDQERHIRGKYITPFKSESKRITKEISILLREQRENAKS
ncbi:MAG: redoxin domain-containing protein [Flavobacteriales bacterium]|nr:redoxin domain-containing protein [Flavobacteriales bacterium]